VNEIFFEKLINIILIKSICGHFLIGTLL